MKYQTLLAQSQAVFDENPLYIKSSFFTNIFGVGAKWMFEKLNEKRHEKLYENTTETPPLLNLFDPNINYFAYGCLKYGLSFAAFFVAILVFYTINFCLLPLAIPAFYIVEVHFLFLFPLLIDKVENPIFTSIKTTYKIGLYRTLTTVMPIGFYMVFGLLNHKNPYKNWYIGCLSIIIWYKNEIRNII